ncbi:MAG: FAD-dependent oxidoreductase, partial [Spirochaetes bacterium]|nr:FAD-dependent oxidoreductase [Spirochaetota bacterium]
MENYDAIIVGTGIAGLSAAVFLKEQGLNVIILTKEDKIEESNTYYAQGGIIAWKEGDSPENLINDIYKAGCFYNKKKAVETLANDGPELVFDFLINQVGIKFSKNQEGKIDYTEEAAHSDRRIVHYQDHTGEQIIKSLINYVKK